MSDIDSEAIDFRAASESFADLRALRRRDQTSFRARRSAPAVDELDRAILDALAGSPGLSTAQIARRIGRSARATRSRLASLVERGLVAELGTGPHDPRRKYLLVHAPTREGREP